jgi:glycine/D-amino acid oxidase-like deaminating enzyme
VGLTDDTSLWLAAGFEGLGITCSAGAARLVVDSLLERESAIDHTPYLASRFTNETHQEDA